jgi:hypothetical protein
MMKKSLAESDEHYLTILHNSTNQRRRSGRRRWNTSSQIAESSSALEVRKLARDSLSSMYVKNPKAPLLAPCLMKRRQSTHSFISRAGGRACLSIKKVKRIRVSTCFISAAPHDAVLGSLTDADMAEENVNNVLLYEDASTHK